MLPQGLIFNVLASKSSLTRSPTAKSTSGVQYRRGLQQMGIFSSEIMWILLTQQGKVQRKVGVGQQLASVQIVGPCGYVVGLQNL